jgi:hypothetical protein
MILTIQPKNGQAIRFNTDDSSNYKTSSAVFQLIEKVWWQWFEETKEHNSEIEDMYFSEDAIYCKKGAIIQAIEQIAEVAEETNKTYFKEAELYTHVDIECAFN